MDFYYFRIMFLKTRIVWLFWVSILFLGLHSCKKYGEEVIPNNVPPPDKTISEVVMQTYVNKAYISILGRKPTESEFSEGFALVKQGNLDEASRLVFLDIVMTKPEYYPHVYDLARQELLNDLDTGEVTFNKTLFEYLITLPENAAYAQQFQAEINRLDSMQRIPSLLASNQPFVVAQMHKLCVDNYFYDQLNMGTFNFVTSCFEHFLFRAPSDLELFNGSQMVDGFSGTLFFHAGGTKNEFLHIFFSDGDAYYQGQVRELFQRYLFREPSSEETLQLALQYRNSGDYKALQKKILSMNEYVGLK
jgi:hypothetical protein